MIALLLAAQLHFGPTWGPVRTFPVATSVSEGQAAEVRLVSTRWNYETRSYSPAITKAQKAWLKKYGHILEDWRWDLKANKWVRLRKGALRCLS